MKHSNLTKFVFKTVALIAFGFSSVQSQAQDARVQIIHNAASVALDTVDVYVNDTKIDNVVFRSGTGIIRVPAGTYNVNLNNRNSTDSGDQVLARFSVSLAANSGNTIMAVGVEDTTLYASNPEGRNRLVQLIHRKNVLFGSSNPANVATTIIHGVTDAPGVNITTRPTSTILSLNNVRYGDTTNNLFIPAQQIFIDVRVNASNNLFRSYLAPLQSFGGKSITVFASGFVTPGSNQSGSDFGLFALDTNGGMAISIPQGVRMQIIHASADTSVNAVDVWLNGTKRFSSLNRKSATNTISAIAGTYRITVTKSGSANDSAGLLYKMDGVPLVAGRNYLGIASGVLDTNIYATNPNGTNRTFNLFGTDNYNETGIPSNATLWYFNGVADADLTSLSRGTTNPVALFNNVAFGDIANSVTIPTTPTSAYVLRENIGGTLQRTFRLRLPASVGGRVGTIFSVGYADTTGNPSGVAMSSYHIAFTDGSVVSLDELNAYAQIIHTSADPSVATVDVYINGVKALDDFKYASATPFLPIVPYKANEVKIAPANSTSTADAFFTTNITGDSSKYHYAVVAGVRNPASFAPNPDGVDRAFTVIVNNEAKINAAISDKNIDLMYFHSIADAPKTTSIGFNQIQYLSKDNAYKSFHGYRSHAAFGNMLFELKKSNTDTILYRGYANLLNHPGKTGFIFAGGFINSASNQNGPSAFMYIVWPEGFVDTIGLSSVAGITDGIFDESGVVVYPNPSNTIAQLQIDSKVDTHTQIIVSDITGKIVYEAQSHLMIGKNSISIPVANWNNGLYVVRATSGNNTVVRKLAVSK
jgi:hypothetical protein